MDQLPIFVNLRGQKLLVLGEGAAAEAKIRLAKRAGAEIVRSCPCAASGSPPESCCGARLAFIAIEDAGDDHLKQLGKRLRARGILVNIVDRPEYCDFTTPAIIDRAPVLIAIGTGGASAGLAKALRQRLETLLPQTLGQLARNIYAARSAILKKWPSADERRRAIDSALAPSGILDPFSDTNPDAVDNWLEQDMASADDRLIIIDLSSNDPDDLSLRTARLLGQADHIFHGSDVSSRILNRARADAQRHEGEPPAPPPQGLSLYLRLPVTG